MSNSDRTFLGACVIFTTAITVLLTVLGQPFWLGLALCVPVAGAAFAIKVRSEKQPQPQYFAPQPPPPPAPPGGEHIQNAPLPSADRDYRFLLHGHVRWRPLTDGFPSSAVAVNALLQRAGAITAQLNAADHDLIRPRLAAELGTPAPDATGRVEVWLEEVAVSLPDADLQRLARLASVRKDEEVWEHERAHERNVRAYLRDDVLQSTGSAVVWWLAQDTTKVADAVALIDSLAKLSDAAQDRVSAPAAERGLDERVRDLLEAFAPGAEEFVHAELADRLARLATSVGAVEVAERIRHDFNAPDLSALAASSDGAEG